MLHTVAIRVMQAKKCQPIAVALMASRPCSARCLEGARYAERAEVSRAPDRRCLHADHCRRDKKCRQSALLSSADNRRSARRRPIWSAMPCCAVVSSITGRTSVAASPKGLPQYQCVHSSPSNAFSTHRLRRCLPEHRGSAGQSIVSCPPPADSHALGSLSRIPSLFGQGSNCRRHVRFSAAGSLTLAIRIRAGIAMFGHSGADAVAACVGEGGGAMTTVSYKGPTTICMSLCKLY